MMQEADKVGCPVDPSYFECTTCDQNIAGGFAPNQGIVLCENKLSSREHTEDTMVHEMVHLFDHCARKIDWTNPRHIACSEIRANTLSGECKWSREIKRGHFNFGKQFQECIRRRAILGLHQLPPSEAAQVVDSVWDECFNDLSPFDEIY